MVAHLIDENDPQQGSLKAPYIKLYTEGTPNGHKISIMLELLKLDFHARKIDISKNEQKEKWFLELNPNGRIPTLIDEDASGNKITISESGAILLYLADKYDKENKFSYPYGTSEYWKMVEVLMFQMAGVGPMQGQAAHFMFFAPEKIPYAIERYTNETKRLFGVLEDILEGSKTGFLVGDRLTIADVACWPWVSFYEKLNIDLAGLPRLAQWIESLGKMDEFVEGKKLFQKHF